MSVAIQCPAMGFSCSQRPLILRLCDAIVHLLRDDSPCSCVAGLHMSMKAGHCSQQDR